MDHLKDELVGTLQQPDLESDYMFKPCFSCLKVKGPDQYELDCGDTAKNESANFRFAWDNVLGLFRGGFSHCEDGKTSQQTGDSPVLGIDALFPPTDLAAIGGTRLRDALIIFSNFRDLPYSNSGAGPAILREKTDKITNHGGSQKTRGTLRKIQSS